MAAALAFAGAGAKAPSSNFVVSKDSPELTLIIDPHFRALKPLRFPIEKLTIAERRIFFDVSRGRIVDRLVIVHFEKVQPGSHFLFLYPSIPPDKFGADTYCL